MPKKVIEKQKECLPLDVLPQVIASEPIIKRLRHKIWTENKSKLIGRYLYYFVLVTRHGTYIDGFAGPQEQDGSSEMWSARQVLESEPRWFRHFHLFDKEKQQVEYLQQLKAIQPARDSKGRKIYRDINIRQGDFNVLVHDLLNSKIIKQTEATFCLLDQRTFECHWATVKALAEYKNAENNKIELFYFLPIGWLGRALSAQQDVSVLEKWWGGPDWQRLLSMSNQKCADTFVERFRLEFGYSSVKAWPIFGRASGGKIMYYMVHATDHPDAPLLMSRAYERAVQPKETYEQLEMEFGPSLFAGIGNCEAET